MSEKNSSLSKIAAISNFGQNSLKSNLLMELAFLLKECQIDFLNLNVGFENVRLYS